MSTTAVSPDLQRARSPRRRVALSGTLETLQGQIPVACRNLSATGALVEGCNLPAAGRDVVLKVGPLDCFATVVWAAEGRCGLSFDEPVSFEQVLALHHISADMVARRELKEAEEWFRTAGDRAAI